MNDDGFDPLPPVTMPAKIALGVLGVAVLSMAVWGLLVAG